jgi:hypothetical protein
MDDGMVVIITLPRNPEAADLLGGIILAQLRQAGFDRMGTPMASRHFRFFVDEVHRFVDTSGAALESTINECEKGGLSLSLAHQTTAQLSPELLKGLYGMANIVVLRTNLLDARQLAPVFNGLVPPENLSSLRTGECYARIDGDIVHCQCLPTTAAYDAELAARIIRRSREQFYATNQEPKAGPPPSRRARVIKSLTKGETNV